MLQKINTVQAAASVWARAGASVVLAGRRAEELTKVEKATKAVATDPSARIISVIVDVTIEIQVQSFYAQVQKVFGRPADTLINNAGIGGTDFHLGETPWDQFTSITHTCYFGAALMSKYYVSSQPTPKDPVGTIIFMTSGLESMDVPGISSYAIAKLAGHRLIELLDVEYPRLRTFCLAPGLIMTNMMSDMYKPFAKDHVEMPGMMAVYLSQERADFLRGGYVQINWDIKEMEANKKEIVEKKLLKLQWLPAKFGIGGHPFGA
jgi:NAD(P)-dependent dehydrogenase (short-subunit alcohol dehydrogenase family)